MHRVIHHLRLWIALLATLSYLGLGVTMARGDGTVVIDGNIWSIADLCGDGDGDGSGCPFCTLGKAPDLPVSGPVAPVLQLTGRCFVPARRTTVSTVKYVRPPVRGPPLL